MEKRDLERIMLSYNEAHCFPPLGVEEVLRIVVSACSFPAEKSAEKSLRRQNENPLWWFRFNVRNWHSDQSVNAMSDFQTGWYIRLLVFAWSKGGYLTADMSQLWRLAGAKSLAQFRQHCELVLMDFDSVTEHDGNVVLRHRYMAAEYAVTLKKWMKKINGGEMRAKINAESSAEFASGNSLLESVHAAELVGGIHPAAELMETDDRNRGILAYLEAAGDEAFAFEPLLSANEAAELLGIHVNTLRLWARGGKVPSRRMGRRVTFRKSQLNRWWEEPCYAEHAVLTASTERKAA
jgi:excisionase family DNA binding protein